MGSFEFIFRFFFHALVLRAIFSFDSGYFLIFFGDGLLKDLAFCLESVDLETHWGLVLKVTRLRCWKWFTVLTVNTLSVVCIRSTFTYRQVPLLEKVINFRLLACTTFHLDQLTLELVFDKVHIIEEHVCVNYSLIWVLILICVNVCIRQLNYVLITETSCFFVLLIHDLKFV